MADPSPPPDASSVDFTAQINNIPKPPMDSLLFADDDDAFFSEAFPSDFDLGLDGDFEINFDDLDNLHLPFNVDEFLFDDASLTPSQIGDDSHGVADCDNNPTSDVARFSNPESYPPTCLDYSGDQNPHGSNEAKVSPESDSCDRESSGGPVSSQGSANGGSGVSDVTDSPSPTRYNRDFTSQVIVDENAKLDEIGRGSDLKRKMENNGGNAEARTTKHRRSSRPVENVTREPGVNVTNGDDEKKKARLVRNRESAQLSRQRKKQYVEELEEKVKSMHSTIADLSGKISFVMAENATLRQRLSAGGMGPPPPAPGTYNHPPVPTMPYPWLPYAPYVANPLGSQVPLVPIPRLKPQQLASASKSKVSERKKSEGKTKKVASVCFLGLLFFVLLFGGLSPLVNVKFNGLVDDTNGRSQYVSDRFYGQLGGKVWPVNGPINRGADEKGRNLGEETHKQLDSRHKSGSDAFVHLGNTSQPLFASLYVPRNDKLVKIDGNLIINSVLASEKAMASETDHIARNNKRETGLALSNYWDSALAIPKVGINRGAHPYSYSSPHEQRKALPDGSAEILKDHLKSSSDGKVQQWFREGLAGPMLSSGMCTEVFQFDISSTQGAIVPASSAANVSEENHQNVTRLGKSRNRRILHRLPLAGSSSNASEERGGGNSLNDNFLGNKSKSSMVVSVLVDPKEAGDFDGMMKPKSLSRIFVVVLVDSIKYVTYSCVLPRTSPHRVTA
ncbi:bZIP transcription factor 17 isoform X2 [Neltuma alba]|uniref:bZIP transcription factor 17 isoform X2 n=1 Tax=Neltuma alba TaxID=207710 RepID=UPI0010A2F5BB|nr:bZIP transcription factor 17-like isoform X2 [Prosopis alba]